MRTLLAITLVLFTALLVNAQAPTPTDPAVARDLAEFKAFIEQHPVALAEFKKDPSKLGTPEFARNHRRVGAYVAAHPKLVEHIKANPKFVEGLSPKRRGGTGGGKGL